MKFFAQCSIPDGYNGDRRTVKIFIQNNKICFMADCGWFPSHLPNVIDENEAIWILKNHPKSKSYIKSLVIYADCTND
jgi:hypothetical protein